MAEKPNEAQGKAVTRPRGRSRGSSRSQSIAAETSTSQDVVIVHEGASPNKPRRSLSHRPTSISLPTPQRPTGSPDRKAPRIMEERRNDVAKSPRGRSPGRPRGRPRGRPPGRSPGRPSTGVTDYYAKSISKLIPTIELQNTNRTPPRKSPGRPCSQVTDSDYQIPRSISHSEGMVVRRQGASPSSQNSLARRVTSNTEPAPRPFTDPDVFVIETRKKRHVSPIVSPVRQSSVGSQEHRPGSSTSECRRVLATPAPFPAPSPAKHASLHLTPRLYSMRGSETSLGEDDDEIVIIKSPRKYSSSAVSSAKQDFELADSGHQRPNAAAASSTIVHDSGGVLGSPLRTYSSAKERRGYAGNSSPRPSPSRYSPPTAEETSSGSSDVVIIKSEPKFTTSSSETYYSRQSGSSPLKKRKYSAQESPEGPDVVIVESSPPVSPQRPRFPQHQKPRSVPQMGARTSTPEGRFGYPSVTPTKQNSGPTSPISKPGHTTLSVRKIPAEQDGGMVGSRDRTSTCAPVTPENPNPGPTGALKSKPGFTIHTVQKSSTDRSSSQDSGVMRSPERSYSSPPSTSKKQDSGPTSPVQSRLGLIIQPATNSSSGNSISQGGVIDVSPQSCLRVTPTKQNSGSMAASQSRPGFASQSATERSSSHDVEIIESPRRQRSPPMFTARQTGPRPKFSSPSFKDYLPRCPGSAGPFHRRNLFEIPSPKKQSSAPAGVPSTQPGTRFSAAAGDAIGSYKPLPASPTRPAYPPRRENNAESAASSSAQNGGSPRRGSSFPAIQGISESEASTSRLRRPTPPPYPLICSNQPARKKSKLADIILPINVTKLIPESMVYLELVNFERKIDMTIMRKQLSVQEALKRPMTIKRKLRLFIQHTCHPANKDTVTIPLWELRVEGRLLGVNRDEPRRKFSSFFKSLVIEMDREMYGPDNHLVEWHRSPSTQETDGFQVKRQGDQDVRCSIQLTLDHQPLRFKLDSQLAYLLGVNVETQPVIMSALWQYIKTHDLQDARDNCIINCDKHLEQILGHKTMKFSDIPLMLNSLLYPPDPIIIDHTISARGDPMACYDIEVQVDCGAMAQMSNFLKATAAEKDINSLNDTIHETVKTVKQLATNRNFFLSFSKDPQQFINRWNLSQARDLQFMTDVVGNPEYERRSEFYYQPAVPEAVGRYFYNKVQEKRMELEYTLGIIESSLQ